jgi:hypothetical protein
MNWIRVDVGIAADPKLHQFAKALKVRRAEAVGLFVMTLCQFPDHAREGDIAKVSDETLAEWAGWTKKPGAYAAAFRAVFCDGSSTVSGWDKHNGAPLRKAENDARRKREGRAGRGDVQPDVAATSGVRDERDETDETGRPAVAVHCDSKKQFAVRSSTQNPARTGGGFKHISELIGIGGPLQVLPDDLLRDEPKPRRWNAGRPA